MIKHPDDRSGNLLGPFISDTPRTDAVIAQCLYLGRKVPDAIEAFARQLERELAKAKTVLRSETTKQALLPQGGRDPHYPSGGCDPKP